MEKAKLICKKLYSMRFKITYLCDCKSGFLQTIVCAGSRGVTERFVFVNLRRISSYISACGFVQNYVDFSNFLNEILAC